MLAGKRSSGVATLGDDYSLDEHINCTSPPKNNKEIPAPCKLNLLEDDLELLVAGMKRPVDKDRSMKKTATLE